MVRKYEGSVCRWCRLDGKHSDECESIRLIEADIAALRDAWDEFRRGCNKDKALAEVAVLASSVCSRAIDMKGGPDAR